ncbi:MAG: hypothetical protein KDC95_01785 [Planctomycetes bacterium]|nr:hypothetical protein [Planctomycetota bacterium]
MNVLEHPVIARGLRIETRDESIATPSLSPLHAARSSKDPAGIRMTVGGGILLCSQVEMAGWSDWNIEVIEPTSVVSISVEWRLDGNLVDIVRFGDKHVARGTRVVHVTDVRDVFFGRMHLRRLPPTMPDDFESCLVLTSHASDWILRSTMRSRPPEDLELDAQIAFHRRMRVSPELSSLTDESRTLAAGTKIRLGLTEVTPI